MRKKATRASMLSSYVRNNRTTLAICTMALVLGIVFGSMYCITVANKGELANSMGDFSLLCQESEKRTVFLSSIVNYLQLTVFIWLCGCTRLGIPTAPLLIALKGFACGFCVSSLMSTYKATGVLAAGLGILPHMMIVFAIMEVFCVAAINQALYGLKISDKLQRRRRFVSYCVFCLMLFILFILCSLFESYVSPHILRWALEI